MVNFKEGDKVEIHTNSECGHSIGTVGSIHSRNKNYYNCWYVSFKDREYTHSEHNLKLVNKEVNLMQNLIIW